MKTQRIIASIAIAAAAALSTPAEARRAPAQPGAGVTQFCGDRVCPTFEASATASAPRAGRQGARSERRARRTPHRSPMDANGAPAAALAGRAIDGVIRSKAGAVARVAVKWAAKFQAYVDDLEAMGAKIYYMGGYRRGQCSAGSQHPCGSALDVCQDRRGRVSGAKDCHLPGPARMAAAAARHGLTEGGTWCGSPDYGHVQAIKSGSTCAARGWIGNGKRQYLASMTGEVRTVSARRHKHKRARYAGAR